MTEQQPATPPAPATTAVADPPPPPYVPVAGESRPPRRRLRDRVRGVPRAAWLSAAAVIVVVGVGLGGFLIGRATAPDGGFPDRGQRPDLPGGGPGQGQMPGMPGQQSQPGQPGSDAEGSADTTGWYVVPQAS